MVYVKLEKTDMKILSYMVNNINREYSIKELADHLKTPYVKIHASIQRLEQKKIIKKKILGKSHYCSFEYRNNLDIACFIEAQKAREFMDKNKRIRILMDNLKEELTIPDYSLIIFGSFAINMQTGKSDLDIAIISQKNDLEKAERTTNAIARTSNIKTHTISFTYNDFIKMLRSKELTVGKEILKHHVILHGCEQFYECARMSG